jgi:hypothetical protein
MIGFVDSFQFTNVPTGIIIPWASDSASPPAGWTFVTPPNAGVSGFSGCYILGAGNTYAVGVSGISGAPAGHVQFDSTYDGAHKGAAKISSITAPTQQPTFTYTWKKTGGVESGSHAHTIDSAPIMGYNQYQLIKASTQAEKFPANGVLLNTAHSSIPWLTATGTDGKYLRAGNKTGTAVTSSVTSMVTGSAYDNGKHTHAWWPAYKPAVAGTVHYQYIFNASPPAGANADGLAGYHLHDFNSVSIVDYLRKVYTTAWTYASDFYGFRGMIGFWEGSAGSIPAGWAICDGVTPGTIDMRDHFVMMSTNTNRGTRTGTNVINVIPTSGNMLASNNFTTTNQGHKHYDGADAQAIGGAGGNIANTAWHETVNVPHDHPLTQGTSKAFMPQFCALYIIQKL